MRKQYGDWLYSVRFISIAIISKQNLEESIFFDYEMFLLKFKLNYQSEVLKKLTDDYFSFQQNSSLSKLGKYEYCIFIFCQCKMLSYLVGNGDYVKN